MTRTKYNQLVSQAMTQGELVEHTTTESPFSCGEDVEVSVYEIEGFRVVFKDNTFAYMMQFGVVIHNEDLTEFDVDEMQDSELEQLIKDAQRTLKNRQLAEAKKAIAKFEQAWNELKQFGEVRLRVNATGETHFHTTVDKLRIDVLPLN